MVEDRGKENRPAKLPPDIRFEHVTFRYQDGQEAAVKDLSFQLSPGETVALVGSSGAGKTTCTNLLLRYWDVEDGCISIGGTDIREISLDSLHQMTSAVLQEVYLFHTTIRENIRLGKPDATDQEVEWAAKAALAHEFILQLPEGYETKVEERGSSLSGGQRQRIAIARALLKNAPILIMDEAVSSLDTENEKEIQHTLNTVCRDKTILLVAHRLSTIASADRLIVLDHGRVVQTGRHEDLIRQDGYYRDLICKNFSAGNDAAG